MITIYALVDPRTKLVFYIGASADTPKHIVGRHMGCNAHFGIRRQLKIEGLKPVVEALETTSEVNEARKIEEYWIGQFRTWGFVLDNKRTCSGYPNLQTKN